MTPADRALAKLSPAARNLVPRVEAMQKTVDDAGDAVPLPIRRQLWAVREELDLLRHALREETIRRAVGGPDLSEGRAVERLRTKR